MLSDSLSCLARFENRRTHVLQALALIGLLLGSAADVSAGTLTATWDMNREPDIAGYILSYGTESGDYSTSIDVGNVTTKDVDVVAGPRYYFVVQAYNTRGEVGARSEEVAVDSVVKTPQIASLSPESGTTGTAVTITGSDFGEAGGTGTVQFNGSVAMPSLWGPGTIVVAVPSDAATGMVTVTVDGITSNGVSFTVEPLNLAPTLAPPADQASAENAIVSLQVTASDPEGAALTYSATGLPPGLDIDAATGLISGTPTFASAGTYTVTATASDGSLASSENFTWTIRIRPTPGDFDGDGRTDVAVYRPSSQRWRIRGGPETSSQRIVVEWGASSVIAVTGDFDGDRKADMAYYEPTTAGWFILESSSENTTSQTITLGTATAVPVPGDYDGDAITDIAVYEPATGEWRIRKSSTKSVTSLVIPVGARDDVPVPGDYDGDGRTDLAIYRPATGTWNVWQSSLDYATDRTIAWGMSGDIAVPGDYDGDGRPDLAMYRPADGSWNLLLSGADYATSLTIQFGGASHMPVAGDYDGDGRADLGLFRSGAWQIRLSQLNYTTSITAYWGRNGDVPLPARP